MLGIGQKVVCVNTVVETMVFGMPTTAKCCHEAGASTPSAPSSPARSTASNRTGCTSWRSSIRCAATSPRRGRSCKELAFRISRFRPVRSTNVDVFRAMLEPGASDAKEPQRYLEKA